jgi:serine/threonine protein kinase
MVRVFAADDFVLSKGTPLASGSFGVVRVARHRGLGTLHAAKGLPQRTQLRFDSVQEELIRSEMVNHARASARSSYVSRFDGMFEDGSEGWTYLVQELCTGKTLQERGVPDAKEVAPITRALLHALAGCAEAGIVHNDVKPSNIMCGGSQQAVRLIDFGSSQQLPPGSAASARVRFATPAFAAPEVLQSGLCSQVSDSWGAGAVLYAMLTGAAPVLEGGATALLPLPVAVAGAPARDLVACLLQPDPALRLHPAEALTHPFLRQGT